MLNKRYKGFMAKTHALLSLCLFALVILTPLPFIQQIINPIMNDYLLFAVCTVELLGATLLTDLDNDESFAGHLLGPLGSVFTLAMKSSSSVVWQVYHLKRDKKPETQHRYLWHTFLIGISFILLFYFGIPKGNYTIFTNISNSIEVGELGQFIIDNSILLFFMLIAFTSALTGSAIVIKFIKNFVHVPGYVKYIAPVLLLVYIFTTTYTNLRSIGVCIGMGYLFHCMEDFFTNSGIPMFFPIPIFGHAWKKVHFPITISTGSAAETIVTFIAGIMAVILFVLVFMGG